MDSLFTILVVFVVLYSFALLLSKYINLKVRNTKFLSASFLLAWIALGFLTNLDYNTRAGCLVTHQPVLSKENIIFSIISFLIILGVLKTDRVFLARVGLWGELLFWLFKLFFVKGGYSVGFGGSPSDSVVFYDFVAMFLRLYLFSFFFEFGRNSAWKILLAVIGIMLMKVSINRGGMFHFF